MQGEERRKEVAKWIRSRTNSREFPGGPVIRALHFSLSRARFKQKLHGLAEKKKKKKFKPTVPWLSAIKFP